MKPFLVQHWHKYSIASISEAEGRCAFNGVIYRHSTQQPYVIVALTSQPYCSI